MAFMYTSSDFPILSDFLKTKMRQNSDFFEKTTFNILLTTSLRFIETLLSHFQPLWKDM